MRGVILIADAVRAHNDGTFSLLRGGIDRIRAPRTQPIHFRGSFLIRMTGGGSEAGRHDFQLRLRSEDGQSVVPDINGSFNVPDGGGSSVAVGDFNFVLPRYGRYTFDLLVDQQESSVWEIQAVELPQTTGAE